MITGTAKPFLPVTQENLAAVTRLTALWGLSESGLGGIMFAFRLPFTGFLLGAVAIVLLSLIAKHSNYSYRRIISATVIVVMVKAAASPHSSLPAYFAVSFQGFTAALLFSTLRSHKLACVLVGIITMAESSLQKLIVLTLLFGKSVFEATNNLGREIAKTFSLQPDHNYALWLIVSHTVTYMIWGAVVGAFAAGVPARIEKQKQGIIDAHNRLKTAQPPVTTAKRRKAKRWLGYAGILLFIIAVFLLSGANSKQVMAIVLRTLAAVLLMVVVVLPLLRIFFRKWLSRRTKAEREGSQEVLQLLPALRSFVPDAYAVAKTQTGFFNRAGNFLVAMIILTLYAGQPKDAPLYPQADGG